MGKQKHTKDDVTWRYVARFFANAVKPHRKTFIVFFTLTGIASLAWTGSTFAIAKLIDELTVDTAIDRAAVTIVVVFLGLRIVNQLFYRLADYAMHFTQPKLIEEIRSSLYQDVMRRSYRFFANASSGRVAHWVNTTADTFDTFLQMTFWNMWGRLLGMLTSIVFLAITHWLLAVIFVLWLICLFAYTTYRGRTFSKLIAKWSNEKSKSVQLIVDGFANNTIVRMLSAQQREADLLSKQQKVSIRNREEAWIFNIRTNFAKDFSSVAATAAALIVALWLLSTGQIGIGGIVLFFTYFSRAAFDLWVMAWVIDQYFANYGTVLDALQGLRGENERRVTEAPDRSDVSKVAIDFNDLTFVYPEQKDVAVLDKINVSISAGQKVGVVGHSGAGKTTLLGLLLAFFEPTDGTIYINGEDYKEHDPSWVRAMSSFVPQDTIMFNRSIFDNVVYARPDATKAEVRRALEQAQALDFVDELPKGLDTIVGERGVKLSGGQRQRIAIARAILRDSPLLLLDEATSALDSVSEQAIQKALQKLMKHRTALVIAHRLSTLKHLDRIIVLENGRIIEEGNHDQLLRRKGVYADLWKRQKDGFIAE
jgi:ATP-binding cassette subfamily B protein